MKAINKCVLCQDMINAVRKSKAGKSGEWEGGWELFYTRCSGKVPEQGLSKISSRKHLSIPIINLPFLRTS